MSNFFNKHDIIMSLTMLLWLIPTYLIWRSAIAMLFKIAGRFNWNLRLFSADRDTLTSLKLFYYARLLPNPYWNDDLKEKWASSWWICGILGIVLFYIHFEVSIRI